MRLASFLFDELDVTDLRQAAPRPTLNGRSLLTGWVAAALIAHPAVEEFAVCGAHEPPLAGAGAVPFAQIGAWLDRGPAVWFEAARHYWWRPGLVRRTHGRPFPVVTMMHSLGYGFQFGPLALSLATPSVAGDTVIAPGAYAADVFRRQCENILQLLELDAEPPATAIAPYGVPPVAPIPREVARALLGWGASPMILFVGRLSYRDKADFDALFEAAARLAAKGHAFRLVLAGADADRQGEALRARANDYALAPVVEILPNISEADKRALLSACDIFVSPSNTASESFGLTLIEAMLHARPVVCTAWSGYREIVRDGVDGLLVDTWWHDNPALDLPFVINQTDSLATNVALDTAQLASCLERLLLDPELRQRMGDAGRERAHSLYTIDRVADRIVDVLAAAAERAQGQRVERAPLLFASALGAYASQPWSGAGRLREAPGFDMQRLLRTGSPQDLFALKNDCLNGLVPGHADERFRLLRRGMARPADPPPDDSR